MALHQRYNNENILVRAIIAGLLNILNNKISYEQVWSNTDVETITVPWFYNMAGDERFMQDFYTHYAQCLPPKPADGNFDMVPRGIITYKGSPIDSNRITSRYVQGTYLKEVDGQLQTMRSFLYQIPLTANFDAEMWIDNQISGLKIEQAIRETFYKTITFYVYYRGMRIGSSVGFPEDITLNKNIQYSFESNNRVKINFSLQVETYQPVFDPTTEVNNNQNMTALGLRIIDKKDKLNDGVITISPETNYTGMTISKGWPYIIEWSTRNENAIINKVDIMWGESGQPATNIIERGVNNNEYYVWNIPQNFTPFKSPIIIWPTDASDGAKVYRDPVVAILPALDTNRIDSSSFIIVDPGYFLSQFPDASINIMLEMRDNLNNVVYTFDNDIYAILHGNVLKEIIVPVDKNIIFPADVYSKTIDIYIINSVAEYNTSLPATGSSGPWGIIQNVTIV